MKTVIFFSVAFLLLSFNQTKAQSNDPQNMQVVVNQEPHYPAGDQALYMLIYNKLKYPEKPKGTLIQGQVLLSFDVLPDSSLTNIVLLQGVEDSIDQQIINIMKSVKFAPSIQNNTPVKMNTMYSYHLAKRYN